MFRIWAILAFISLLEATACPTGGDTSIRLVDEKKARLKSATKLYQLLQNGGLLDESIFHQNSTREFALIGCLSDTMNQGSTPRSYKVIQEYIVSKFDVAGNFEVYVSTNSLCMGDEYFYLYGVLLEKDLEAKLDFRELVNGDLFEGGL